MEKQITWRSKSPGEASNRTKPQTQIKPNRTKLNSNQTQLNFPKFSLNRTKLNSPIKPKSIS
ncbi:hypothetical protein HYC85_020817 [Camellia sinensis]|uniref:Uncharacterized protein n=1 Tax=Camellia sinensis TaxID=4442 RepID=A0A7J7GSM6_CAMSI|nr:hypothetical protein HYC85_020817 [Camellia sinensis]